MQVRILAVAALLILLLAALLLLLFGDLTGGAARPAAPAPGAAALQPATAGDAGPAAASAADAPAAARAAVAAGFDDTGVRGVVLDARTGAPLGGVEVLAVREVPSMQPLLQRFRGLFRDGLWQPPQHGVQELGRTVSRADGSFELLGLRDGLLFLDGRSDGWFVRTPASARLARGEIRDGIELRASPAGRVRGVVLGADGAPAAGAAVDLRPGLNAFLGQLTERSYRWLQTVTDADGRFDLPGVPAGAGYTISASSPTMALEQQFGLEVRVGQVTPVTLQGHPGAVIGGRVVDADGAPVAAACVALVYLDMSRVLFSADGREQPITTDAEGRFRCERVAAGRIAVIAAADGQAPSNIEELAVVDGGIYDDLQLQLGGGATVHGLVVDDAGQPVADAQVELRPFERPNDPEFLKLALKIRRVQAQTGADGRFTVRGMTGERLIAQAGKRGYTTTVRTGIPLDGKPVQLQLQRGATVRGRVLLADGEPAARFRVETRTRPLPPARDGDQAANPAGGAGNDGGADAGEPGAAGDEADAGGFRMRPGRGGRGGGRGFVGAPRTLQLREGQDLIDRGDGLGGDWQEIAAADGRFTLTGLPPGRITVRVRADGCRDAEQRVELAAAQASDELLFQLGSGIEVHGTVVDAGTGQPVADAQVTAYRQRAPRSGRGGGLGFDLQIDPEDFDFLALSSTQGRRSAVTDSKGTFAIAVMEAGSYRFTARHPDLAKASARDVEVPADAPPPPVEIRLDAGGGIEGTLTGMLQRPLADALVVAFSLQTGSMKSSTTDRAGSYRIDGLPPGQYVVFKSRMDEQADNLALELMSNMRLKTTTVREGRFTRLDIHDEGEDGVLVRGQVRERGQPVARALVTALGSDRDGIFGMGVRASSTGKDGSYELVGLAPGSYLLQISRFRGAPVQTSIPIEVPDDRREFRCDIDLPTSSVAGRVLDTRGQPVAGVQVTLGELDGALSQGEGLLGLIAQGGLAQARTDADGNFRLASVAAGSYRLTAGSRIGRGGGRRGGSGDRHGEAQLEPVVVDGVTAVADLLVTLPLAGRITGSVVDGSGNPVAGAQIHYQEQGRAARSRKAANPMLDLFGLQPRPITTDAQGRFEIGGLSPGVYDLRADADGLETGNRSDVAVGEEQVVDVELRVVRGATLRLRATNVDRRQIPLAQVTLLDGNGKRVVDRMSTLTLMRRLMRGREQVDDSGWYEFGSVPPGDYTLVIQEPGKPELRLARSIADGETVAWDIDVAAELAARAGGK